MQEQLCPKCKSENVYYSKKRSCYVCEDCEEEFIIEKTNSAKKLFFSYGHDSNKVIVDRIKQDLEKLGYIIWIDYERIQKGDNWRSKIYEGVTSSNQVLAFLSSHSSRENGVCHDELRIALCEKGAYIQPILLENIDSFSVPQNVIERQWIDMSQWNSFDFNSESFEVYYKERFNEILKVLNSTNTIELRGDITSLTRLLNPEMISSKEVKLLKNEFVGRKWLFKTIKNLDINSYKCIHIAGGAGTGKSAISANAQYHLDNVIGVWYCMWDDYRTSDEISFIKTMAFKISIYVEEYRKYILSNAEIIDTLIEKQDLSALLEKLIIAPLQYSIDGNRDCKYFIVDALDEAIVNGNNKILDVLSKIIPCLPKWLKIIVTSRKENEIIQKLKSVNSIEIDLNSDTNSQTDFEEYCKYKLGDNFQKNQNLGENYLLVELCQKSKMTNEDINNLNSYYYMSFTKEFSSNFTANEKKIFAILLNATKPIPVDVFIALFEDDEKEYVKAIRKIREYISYSTENFKTFWMKKTISLHHYSLQQWLLSENAGKYQISKKESVEITLKFFEKLINGHSSKLTSSIIEIYEQFLIKNGYFKELYDLKHQERYLLIKEKLKIEDDYSNKENRIAKLDANKIERINYLSHRISFLSDPIRYHSVKALSHHAGGAMDDYCEYYIFPCCGKIVIGDTTPNSISEDGCCKHYGSIENLPQIIELSIEDQLEFWKNELIREYKYFDYDKIFKKTYERIYDSSISNKEKFNKMSKDSQQIILQSIESMAKNSVTNALEYRTNNLINKIYNITKKLNLSENNFDNIISECKTIAGFIEQ